MISSHGRKPPPPTPQHTYSTPAAVQRARRVDIKEKLDPDLVAACFRRVLKKKSAFRSLEMCKFGPPPKPVVSPPG
eukprot:scaffold22309_cov116-Isochrysis_galbana.AAC.3